MVRRILLASLMALAAVGGTTAAARPPAAPPAPAAATAEHVSRAGQFTMNVRHTVWQTGTTYEVDGIGWTPNATVRTYVEGWSRPPATRQWSTDRTDAQGNFHFSRYERYEPSEHGSLQLYMIDEATGHRNGISIRRP
ncbi:hypothetical protein ACFQ6V_12540 [Streptomyces roseifaciens]